MRCLWSGLTRPNELKAQGPECRVGGRPIADCSYITLLFDPIETVESLFRRLPPSLSLSLSVLRHQLLILLCLIRDRVEGRWMGGRGAGEGGAGLPQPERMTNELPGLKN